MSKMMNVKKTIVFVSLVLLFHYASGQVTKPDIQFVSLEDSFLVQTIDSLIDYEEKQDSLFGKGYGYLNVSYSYNIKNGVTLPDNTRIDTVFQYDIQVTYMHPEEEINGLDDLYPPYFSIINDRVITFNNNESIGRYFGYSESSKYIYRKILEKNLAKPGSPSLKFLRLDEVIRIYYLKNRFTGENSQPIVVRKNLLPHK